MLLILPVLTLACAVAYGWILGRPRFLTSLSSGGGIPSISIVVPARNEEGNIGALLESIRSRSTQPLEVIVVDDDSSDRTGERARESGARVIGSGALPDGWKGKPWACQQGAGVAEGDWILFLDADVRLEDGGLERIAALAGEADTVFSICPHHRIREPYEELSAFFNVAMLAGINAFGIPGKRASDEALFGQCLLISKRHYQQIGGHERVRGEVLENFHLARHLREQGVRRKCFLGRGSVTMRMFPQGLEQLRASWKKGFTGGAEATDRRVLILTSVWITGAMLATVGLVLACFPTADPGFRLSALAAYLIYAWQCREAFRLAGTFSMLNALFFPVSLLFYQGLFFSSLLGRKRGIRTRWKDRDVD